MKLGVMQSYFFPYIGYFQLIKEVDLFIFYEHVNFRKRSYISRNFIIRRGDYERIPVTVSVQAKSHRCTIGDTQIHAYQEWRKSFLNTVGQNYRRAAHFEEMYAFLEHETDREFSSIHHSNAYINQQIARGLGIDSPIVLDNPDCLDLEEALFEKARDYGVDRKTARVIGLCQKYSADHYVNPIGGSLLYDKEDFKRNGITLQFIQSEAPPYQQFDSRFERDLSIIDVLMHRGFSGASEMLSSYHLV